MTNLYKASDGFEYDMNTAVFIAGFEKGASSIFDKVKKNNPILFMAIITAVEEEKEPEKIPTKKELTQMLWDEYGH